MRDKDIDYPQSKSADTDGAKRREERKEIIRSLLRESGFKSIKITHKKPVNPGNQSWSVSPSPSRLATEQGRQEEWQEKARPGIWGDKSGKAQAELISKVAQDMGISVVKQEVNY